MLTKEDSLALGVLIFLCLLLTFLLNYVLNKKNKKQLDKMFCVLFLLMLFWMLCMILQIVCVNIFNVNIKYFFYLCHIGICFMPVVLLFIALIFSRTKVEFSKKHLWLFLIPVLSIIILWTNDFHHLFYEYYSTVYEDTVVGPYFYVHTYYTYFLCGIALYILVKYSIKNSGFFSKQAVLILVGALVPIITNVLGFLRIIPFSIYITPITFAFTIICFSFAIFKFNLFKVAPIALQRIVDRISDSYLVLNDDYAVIDFNQTYITTFHIKNVSTIRGKRMDSFLKDSGLEKNINDIKKHIEKVRNNEKIDTFRMYIEKIDKYFNIEISSIIDKRSIIRNFDTFQRYNTAYRGYGKLKR